MQSHLFLIFLLVATIGVQCQAYSNFGVDGYDGRNGADGRPGRNGNDITFTASGSSAAYDMSGTNGEDAYVGENGGDASQCYQPNDPPYSLQGANGGNGGYGGVGGRGGNGGSLTAYFGNIENLKAVLVRSTPGRGGRGTYGGRGGIGCRCMKSQWTVTQNGNTQTYHCQNGSNGYNGSNGSTGKSGAYGAITLIPQLSPVEPEVSYLPIKMENLEQGPFELSANNWASRSGAKLLFAPGSDLADTYQIFTGRFEQLYRFLWEASRPLGDFKGKTVTLTLSQEVVKVSFSDQVWQDGTEAVESDGSRTYHVKSAILASEPYSLEMGTAAGSGSSFTVEVNDKAGVSNVVSSSFRIDFYTKANVYYYRRYQGNIPPEAVIQKDNTFVVSVGKLPIDPDYLTPGTRTLIYFYMTRSLGKNSGTVKIGEYYTLK